MLVVKCSPRGKTLEVFTLCFIASAIFWAPSRAVFGRITINSSPPHRPAESLLLMFLLILPATAFSASSPTSCPKESFTSLKSSTSSIRIAKLVSWFVWYIHIACSSADSRPAWLRSGVRVSCKRPLRSYSIQLSAILIPSLTAWAKRLQLP